MAPSSPKPADVYEALLHCMLTMYYLDHPISLLDAWAISALVELVRIATFFIPASIGAQEGAFVFATSLVMSRFVTISTY